MLSSRCLRVPPGSQDLLPDGVRRRRRAQEAWFRLAHAAGYQEVIPPTFEYEEVFTRGAGAELGGQLIRFLDSDGSLLALRADFTSAIARLVASRFPVASPPQRFCYAGKVYRQQRDGAARGREAFQLGAELIGEGGVGGDVEVLRLLIGILSELEVGPFQINLSHSGYLRPLLFALPPEDAERVRERIDHQDRAGLLRMAAAVRDGGTARLLRELPELVGRSEVLHRAFELATGSEAEQAVRRLSELDAALGPEEREHVVYDLGEVRGLGYYTGIRFEVFVAGAGRAVGFGGRYDELLALYGADRPAVGFALETDVLAELLGQGTP